MVRDQGAEALVSGESLLHGSRMAVCLPCPHMVEGVRELFEVSFVRVLIPFMWAPSLWPSHPPKSPSPNTISMRIRFQHMNLGATQTFSLQQMGTPWVVPLRSSLSKLHLFPAHSSLLSFISRYPKIHWMNIYFSLKFNVLIFLLKPMSLCLSVVVFSFRSLDGKHWCHLWFFAPYSSIHLMSA